MPPTARLTRSSAIATLLVGAGLVAAALVVAMIPQSTSQTNYPTCGSVLFPHGAQFRSGNATFDSLDSSFYASLCEKSLSPLATTSVVLAVAGLAILAWGLLRFVRSDQAAGQVNKPGTAESLESLAALYEQGVLTEEQFEAAKLKVLRQP